MKKMNKAFTMIELLIVIVIMAILAGILFSAFGSAEERAKRNNTKALMLKIHMALESFKEEDGDYPTQDTSILTDLDPSGSAVDFDNSTNTGVYLPVSTITPTYLEEVEYPTNTPGTYTSASSDAIAEFNGSDYLVDAWGNPFAYFYDATNGNTSTTVKEGYEGTYELRSFGADGGAEDDYDSAKDDVVSYGGEIFIKQ